MMVVVKMMVLAVSDDKGGVNIVSGGNGIGDAGFGGGGVVDGNGNGCR